MAMGSVFGRIRFLLPVCRFCRFLYTFNIHLYMHIFRRIFLSNYWRQESDIWSQAWYRYAILWEALLDPSDSDFLFADLVGFYTLYIYAHFSSHFSQQLLMAEIWYLITIELLLTYDSPDLRHTGSRNLTGQKTLATIWGTNMKLVTKYHISAMNSCWAKYD
jgi:hypothetical protein